MKKFWNWKNRTVTNEETQEQIQERTLFLNGTIAGRTLGILEPLYLDQPLSGRAQAGVS